MTKRPTNQSQPSAHEQRNSNPSKINPRERRVLERLLNHGPTFREALDRVSGNSNTPDLIFRMRRKYGVEIKCDRVDAIDRDGQPCRPGLYSLSDDDRIIVSAVLQEAV